MNYDNEKLEKIKELKNLENNQIQLNRENNNIQYNPNLSNIKKSNFKKFFNGVIFCKIEKFFIFI